MTSYTHGRHIAIPEKSVFRLISRLLASNRSVIASAFLRLLLHPIKSLPSANYVETVTPRCGTGEQIAFFAAAGTLRHQLAGIPENRITV
jgi:hypothetical protein